MPTLNWIGKDKVVNYHLKVPYHVLERKYSFDEEGQHKEDNGSENMIIHGDNLLALKSLLPKYEGKIKCIYIDPPYNTGNEEWVYNDNVNDPRIKKWLGEVVGKEGEDLSRHDKWLCMMYPRLRLLQKLLAEDGAIFISIDDNEQAALKFICDEIFGKSNFIANIVWKKKTNGNNMGQIPPVHDFIVVYAKDSAKLVFRGIPLTEEYLSSNYSNPDGDPRGLWTTTDLSANHKGPYFPIINPKTGESFYPPKGRYWVFNEKEVLRRIEDGRIIFGKTGLSKPVQKVFAKERILTQSPDTWFDKQGYNSDGMDLLGNILGKKVFDNPKPLSLLKYIFSFATDRNSIILDSFAGSATTAHAVLEINKEENSNRHFILIEMMDYSDKITAERTKRAINGYKCSKNSKHILFDKKLGVNLLKNGKDLYEEAKSIKEKSLKEYSKVNIKLINNHLQVIGITKAKEEIKGTGGNFSYYELGQPLMKDGFLNEAVGEKAIRQYVYFMDTKENRPEEKAEEPYFLGKHLDTAYYFFYKKDETTTLDYKLLSTVKTKAESYVMYADSCLLSQDELMNYHITFKKIPRDIARL
ncbi:site-specific DNA-methyltransferase [uncultured Dialister sp.]|uniref:site-specific DNA-methyltransferase n=1 Tax=uncultured Dialister sp. TaxID=278064 RepID=UPI00258A6317|nr:site-specific DNA-methyltransferase [uncultured Dialister sp.]